MFITLYNPVFQNWFSFYQQIQMFYQFDQLASWPVFWQTAASQTELDFSTAKSTPTSCIFSFRAWYKKRSTFPVFNTVPLCIGQHLVLTGSDLCETLAVMAVWFELRPRYTRNNICHVYLCQNIHQIRSDNNPQLYFILVLTPDANTHR